MQTFSLRPRLLFGSGALSALEELRERRVLVVTDRFFVTSGLLDRVTEHFAPGGWTVFDKVTPDPSLRLVAEGVAALRAFGPEALVALGGGSPMDCAKAIRHFAGADGAALPLWCIPTTAGTGSEVTAFAVLTDGDKGVKHAVVDDALLPDAALLDPAFLEGVPPAVTADTGMDVLAHAVEGFVAKNASPFTDALAERAFVTAFGQVEKAAAGDMGARERMLYASCMAGMAFNGAGLGVCHSLAHALGGRYHVPHGRLNAMLLPHVVRVNSGDAAAARKYGALAKLLGAAGTAQALAGKLARLRARLGMPERLDQPVAVEEIVETALQDRCTPTNPRPADAAMLRAILQEVSP